MPANTPRTALRELVAAAGDVLASDDPDRLRRRIAMLDELEHHLGDDAAIDDPLLLADVISTRDALEAANTRVYQAIRDDIRGGDGRVAMRTWLDGSQQASEIGARDGYDHLDEILAGVVQFDEPDATSVEPTPEMVFYQPTPARHVLDLLRRTALTTADVLIDLGAGLGHVALLTAMCSDARAIGVELEPAYVACARRAAARLGLEPRSVTFIESDARHASLDEGTVFFLYTPFSGAMLRTMLDALRAQAERRPIRVCTYGPCTRTVALEGWLTAVEPPEPGRVAIFQSSARKP